MAEKISLKIKSTKVKQEVEHQLYPTLWLNDVKLPVGKESVNKLLKAKITLKLVDYGEGNSTKGETRRYSFAIQDIQFTNGAVDAVKEILDKRSK